MPMRGELLCPPPEFPHKTRMHVMPDGTGVCKEESLDDLVRRESSRRKKLEEVEKLGSYLSGDITDLTFPSFASPDQVRLMSRIIGSDEARAMQVISTLGERGIINVRCPPPYHPDWTEQYRSPIDGRVYCRAPQSAEFKERHGEKLKGVACPGATDSPLDIEAQINYFGEVICRRPVLEGATSCPPANDLTRDVLAVTPTGRGVCVTKEEYASTNAGIAHVLFPFDINGRISVFLQLLYSLPPDVLMLDNIMKLNRIFMVSKNNMTLLASALAMDPVFKTYQNMLLENIKQPEDLDLANIALGILYSGKTAITPMSVQSFVEFYGIPEGYNVYGGKKMSEYATSA
jgi:hypothetical protein